MIKQLTGLLHLIISLLFCFYIFIIPTNFNYDFFYILLNTIQIILFILCDNKCPEAYKGVIQKEVFKHLKKYNG